MAGRRRRARPAPRRRHPHPHARCARRLRNLRRDRPHERIVFTWGWDGEASPLPPGSTTVVIELEPEGDGTLVRLTHSDLVAPPIAELHRQGWEHYLERLSIRAQGGDPGVDAVRAEMA